jgi:hypothetical protein
VDVLNLLSALFSVEEVLIAAFPGFFPALLRELGRFGHSISGENGEEREYRTETSARRFQFPYSR